MWKIEMILIEMKRILKWNYVSTGSQLRWRAQATCHIPSALCIHAEGIPPTTIKPSSVYIFYYFSLSFYFFYTLCFTSPLYRFLLDKAVALAPSQHSSGFFQDSLRCSAGTLKRIQKNPKILDEKSVKNLVIRILFISFFEIVVEL